MIKSRQLYNSPNGDRWHLVGELVSARVFVRHEANAASGGMVSDIELADFLSGDANGPEHQALLRLIGSLVDETSA